MSSAKSKIITEWEKSMSKAIDELAQEIAIRENVDIDVALYLIYTLGDLDFESNDDGSVTINLQLKPIKDIVSNVSNETGWEKEMHMKLLKDNNGMVEKWD